MNQSRKLIFGVSIILIFVFAILPIIIHYTPLEFTNDKLKLYFEESRFYGLPISLLMTLFGTVHKSNRVSTKTMLIISTILASGLSMLILFISIFAGMCTWSDIETLFENKNNFNTKIVLRSYGCGAYDSSFPTYKVFIAKRISSNLRWVTSIDTTNLNKEVWTRVKK